ncbi:I78 family peptidase inhibitor [Sphingopyxis chilensis]|uniref:I78 family peptidase inhibitor n=1 Tax=Sphingopyxis chilensis TaxID=180400 RepID=UPI002DDC95AB|nr:I78 family peptidase inhibitor [Sphingopyxis chilensis]
MDFRLLAIAAVLPLAACTQERPPVESAPPPPEAEMTCKVEAVQSYVGQTATPELGGTILKASGARTLRWGPPRSAMTMDYRQDRVNIMYDDAYKITQVTCG